MTKFKVGDRVGWSYSKEYIGTVKEVVEDVVHPWETYVGVLWDHDASGRISKHAATDLVWLYRPGTQTDWQGWRVLD